MKLSRWAFFGIIALANVSTSWAKDNIFSIEMLWKHQLHPEHSAFNYLHTLSFQVCARAINDQTKNESCLAYAEIPLVAKHSSTQWKVIKDCTIDFEPLISQYKTKFPNGFKYLIRMKMDRSKSSGSPLMLVNHFGIIAEGSYSRNLKSMSMTQNYIEVTDTRHIEYGTDSFGSITFK